MVAWKAEEGSWRRSALDRTIVTRRLTFTECLPHVQHLLYTSCLLGSWIFTASLQGGYNYNPNFAMEKLRLREKWLPQSHTASKRQSKDLNPGRLAESFFPNRHTTLCAQLGQRGGFTSHPPPSRHSGFLSPGKERAEDHRGAFLCQAWEGATLLLTTFYWPLSHMAAPGCRRGWEISSPAGQLLPPDNSTLWKRSKNDGGCLAFSATLLNKPLENKPWRQRQMVEFLKEPRVVPE